MKNASIYKKNIEKQVTNTIPYFNRKYSKTNFIVQYILFLPKIKTNSNDSKISNENGNMHK